MKVIISFVVALVMCGNAVLARPNDNIIIEDSVPMIEDRLGKEESTLPPFPRLGMRPEELNSLMLDEGYVYEKPDTPFEGSEDDNKFEGYVYERPKNPMTLPTSSSTTTTTTEEPIIDLPDGSARILLNKK